MKKQLLIIAGTIFLMAAASSCTYKTCPTYTQHDQDQKTETVGEARW